jgi:alpha-amylase
MKAIVHNLMFIHEKIANGATEQRFKNFDAFAYERTGGAYPLVGLNNNEAADRTISVATGFGANVSLHDYTGHAGDVSTDGGGQVTITIPRNTGGLGYACYSRQGIGGAFPVTGRDVAQDYEGGPGSRHQARRQRLARPGLPGHRRGRPIRGALRFDTSHWTSSTSITLELSDPAGLAIATRDYTGATTQGDAITAAAQPGAAGFYSFKIRSANTPAANLKPSYKLSVTYRSPQVLK